MSFLDKIKGKGKARDGQSPDGGGALLPLNDVISLDVPMHDETTPVHADTRHPEQTAHMDSSIITEAAPSEIADFSDTRMPPADLAALGAGTGLPLIGNQPLACSGWPACPSTRSTPPPRAPPRWVPRARP